MMQAEAIKFPHYQAIALIHESDCDRRGRDRNEDSGQSIVIKLMRDEYLSFNELVLFRNQYAIAYI